MPALNMMINIIKRAKKPSNEGSISTPEMRFQFGRVLRAVKATLMRPPSHFQAC